ncbi:outer membrane beta-barrel protein [uncultured Cohaesibacter sp.]|uniref:outer membrane protein n=1 Tax=uncultured Cohaesibacter sp. TaxID=1002546 RepID=UPI00292CC2A1|nr:outer membrane beta-barrel protein [uncultured Cohaesibacter sp.]
MRKLAKRVSLSVFAVAMSTAAAFAADMQAPPFVEYEPLPPVEIGSGWYLRGDLGAAAYSGGHGSWLPVASADPEFYNEHIENGLVAGAGIGYYFNEKLRGDLTVDYHGKAKLTGNAPCTELNCSTIETLNFSAWTLMLNGYYDIGTWNSMTPYIGAGAGMAYLRTSDYTTTKGYAFGDYGKVNFAWNVMAGASFDISDRLKFDTNYRLVSLGTARTDHPTTNPSENPVKFENLYAQEIRVGLRYDLN